MSVINCPNCNSKGKNSEGDLHPFLLHMMGDKIDAFKCKKCGAVYRIEDLIVESRKNGNAVCVVDIADCPDFDMSCRLPLRLQELNNTFKINLSRKGTKYGIQANS